MGRIDAGPVRAAYEAMTRSDRESKAIFRQAERWRDRLVREGGEALSAFTAETGQQSDALEALVAELGATRDEADRKQLGKKIFRLVHSVLASGMQKDAPAL